VGDLLCQLPPSTCRSNVYRNHHSLRLQSQIWTQLQLSRGNSKNIDVSKSYTCLDIFKAYALLLPQPCHCQSTSLHKPVFQYSSTALKGGGQWPRASQLFASASDCIFSSHCCRGLPCTCTLLETNNNEEGTGNVFEKAYGK
jgi:hypothetical protein